MVSSSKVYTTGNTYPTLLKPEAISPPCLTGLGVGIEQYLETVLIAVSQGWGASGIWEVEARDAAEHLTMPRAAPPPTTK